MNLLLINYEYPPFGGGAATATQALAHEFAQLGHRVVVLTDGGPGMPQETVEGAVKVVRVAGKRQVAHASSPREMGRFVSRALSRVVDLARRERIDRTLVFFSVPCGPIAWWLRQRRHIPYVVSLRGGDVPGFEPNIARLHMLLTPLRRAILRGANACVANSTALAELAETSDHMKAIVIPNGVDVQKFRPGERKDAKHARFIFAGRLQEQKRPRLLLAAAKELLCARVDFSLTFVGDGPLLPSLRAEQERLGLGHAVRWNGWASRDELPHLYREADCMVLPSKVEGMSNAVLEAMASGLAIVCSDATAQSVGIDNTTGWIFPADDQTALAACLAMAANSPSAIVARGMAARQRVLDRYRWSFAANAYLSLLESA